MTTKFDVSRKTTKNYLTIDNKILKCIKLKNMTWNKHYR